MKSANTRFSAFAITLFVFYLFPLFLIIFISSSFSLAEPIFLSPRNTTITITMEVIRDNWCNVSLEIIPLKFEFYNESISFTNRVSGANSSHEFIIEYSLLNSFGEAVQSRTTNKAGSKSFYVQKQEHEIEQYWIESKLEWLSCNNANQNIVSRIPVNLRVPENMILDEKAENSPAGNNSVANPESKEKPGNKSKFVELSSKEFEINSFYTLNKKYSEKNTEKNAEQSIGLIGLFANIESFSAQDVNVSVMAYSNKIVFQDERTLPAKQAVHLNFSVPVEFGLNQYLLVVSDIKGNYSDSLNLFVVAANASIVSHKTAGDIDSNMLKNMLNNMLNVNNSISAQNPSNSGNADLYVISNASQSFNNSQTRYNVSENSSESAYLAESILNQSRFKGNGSSDISSNSQKQSDDGQNNKIIYSSPAAKGKKMAYYMVLVVFACIALFSAVIFKK